MRRTRQEQRAATRATLLDAAADVFARHGFHAATVDQVAEAAGLTKGAVYSNFENKEDLFLSVLEHRLDPFPADLASAFESHDRTWLLLKTEFWLHAMRDPDVRFKLAARSRVLRDRVAALVDQAAAERGVPLPATAPEVASIVLALSDGLAVQALIDSASVPDDLFARALAIVLGDASS
ncbi:MAG TPA: TetR/AcrR family transcriptional regulator [Acidimicrobiia bacterium]|nr:TetR/AcrR family transcriptional regulator [Acidimicrobiia bacterium]